MDLFLQVWLTFLGINAMTFVGAFAVMVAFDDPFMKWPSRLVHVCGATAVVGFAATVFIALLSELWGL